uniref:Uncharacterized protein n=1 Tax=Gorilla gorilla gorilla TaxID=9595 RepID=A0A2I2Z3P0_GORGO
MCLNLLAQLLPPGSLSRPRTFSSQPLQTKLMTHNGLFRPIPYLTAVSADEPTASQQPPQAQLHRYNGLFRPSSCLPAFTPGPELSQVDLTRPSSCFFAASPGPALPLSGLCRPRLSSSRPVQGQLLPPGGLCRPKSYSSRPPQAQLRPLGGLSGCKSSSSQPLQAQLLLPPSGLFRPSPAHASRRPSQAPLWTFGGLCRPRQGPASCLPKTCTGPASASQRTLHTQLALASLQPPESKAPASRPLRQAQLPPASGLFRPMGLIPHNSLSRPSFSLPAAEAGPPQIGLSRPTCSLPASSPGPGPRAPPPWWEVPPPPKCVGLRGPGLSGHVAPGRRPGSTIPVPAAGCS